MKVVWTLVAKQDRTVIFDFIARDNPAAAVAIDGLFRDAVARIARFPGIGHAGLVAGTREVIPHESYRLVYEVEEGRVWILAIVHTARLWPPLPPSS